MRELASRAAAGTAALVLAGTVTLALPPPARAEDPAAQSTSSAARYQVTVAARTCTSYAQVMANQVRDDRVEAATAPGRTSGYGAGQAVDPAVEAAHATGCQPLTGWRFSFGKGWQKKGPLSTITTPAGEAGPTLPQTELLDLSGRPTGAQLPGAATVTLTDDQVEAATRRQLWLQGGTPETPVPAKTDGFGVLRCALDGRGGGNVQWVAFPSGSRHVFCFAYYVRGAGEAATLIVRAKPSRKVGHPQRFTFEASASYAAGKILTLETANEAVDATLVRTAGVAQSVTAKVPPGWQLAALSCTKSGAGKSAVGTDLAAGRVDLTPAIGEVVTCAFVYDPPASPPGVTVRLYSDAASAAGFGITVNGEGGPRVLSATPAGDGSAVVATGATLVGLTPATYTVTVSPPAAEVDGWTLAGMTCNGTDVRVEGPAGTVTVTGAEPQDCTLRVTRKRGKLDLRAVTANGVGTAAFAIVRVGEAGPGWSAVASTTGYGVPAAATGDAPAALVGDLLITPLPPKSTVAGGWQLTRFDCDPGQARAAKGGGVINVIVAADLQCTATYQLIPATRLQVMLRFSGEPGGRAGPAVVEVSCVDGSVGRVVLPAEDLGGQQLPEPLGFLEPTKCTVDQVVTREAADGRVVVSAVLDPAPGNAPLSLPATVDIARETAEYLITVTATYEGGKGTTEQARVFDNSRLLPIALIGGGLIGLGLVMLLVMVIRSRVA